MIFPNCHSKSNRFLLAPASCLLGSGSPFVDSLLSFLWPQRDRLANNDIFISSFPVYIYSVFFSYYTKNSSTVLHRSDNRHLFFLDLSRTAFSVVLSKCLAFVYFIFFIRLRKSPSVSLPIIFKSEWVLNFIKCSSFERYSSPHLHGFTFRSFSSPQSIAV